MRIYEVFKNANSVYILLYDVFIVSALSFPGADMTNQKATKWSNP